MLIVPASLSGFSCDSVSLDALKQNSDHVTMSVKGLKHKTNPNISAELHRAITFEVIGNQIGYDWQPRDCEDGHQFDFVLCYDFSGLPDFEEDQLGYILLYLLDRPECRSRFNGKSVAIWSNASTNPVHTSWIEDLPSQPKNTVVSSTIPIYSSDGLQLNYYYHNINGLSKAERRRFQVLYSSSR